MSHHDFGGDWTTEKLNRIRKYLEAYTTIFHQNPRARLLFPVYIDAFAGTGYRTLSHSLGDLGMPLLDLAESDNQNFLKGSTRIALEIEPPFGQYLFIELDEQRAKELAEMKKEFPQHADKIQIVNADANTYLTKWCKNMTWQMRAVMFLDPYGMQVDWSLIEVIAETKKIDLWILFPLGVAVNRLLTRSEPPPESWSQSLTRIFGTEDWKRVFYPKQTVQTLFGEKEQQFKQADFKKISRFFVERLKTIFPAVAENPLPLMNSRNNPLYLLCFAAGNPKSPALKIASDILGRR